MKRKTFISLLLIVAILATLTACGSTTKNTSNKEGNAVGSKKETVSANTETENYIIPEGQVDAGDGIWSKTKDGKVYYLKDVLPEETVTKTDETGKTHTYKGVVTKEPTCEECGTFLYTCTDCGATYEEVIWNLIHAYRTTRIAPTDKEPGYDLNQCTREGCDHAYVDSGSYTYTKKYAETNIVNPATHDEWLKNAYKEGRIYENGKVVYE